MTEQMAVFPRLDRRFWWLGLGLFPLLIDFVLGLNHNFTEIVYSRGLFLLIRPLFDYSLALLPFPLMYLFFLLLVVWAGWLVFRNRQRTVKTRLRNRIASSIFSLLAVAGGALFFFQILWGFNYNRMPLTTYLQFPEVEIDTASLLQEYQQTTRILIETREAIPGADAAALDERQLPRQLEQKLRTLLAHTLEEWDYPVPGRVSAVPVYPKGALMHWGATGIYLPYIGQGTVDGGLHPVSLPFTLAHEMAHGYGFADEGTANFIAFMACSQAEDPFIRYAAWLGYWRHVAGQFLELDPEGHEERMALLPPSIRNDLLAIREVYERYPPFFPRLFSRMYETYLQSQGIPEGMRSYDRVVEMVMAWKLQQTRPDGSREP